MSNNTARPDRGVWAFDIESYPNFFCLVAMNLDTEQKLTVTLDAEHEDSFTEETIEELSEWIESEPKALIGYNSLAYDFPLLIALLNADRMDAGWIYNISCRLFDLMDQDIPHWKYDRHIHVLQDQSALNHIECYDLYKLNHFDRSFTSLKAVGVTLRMPVVADLPYAPGTELTEDQKIRVTEYCSNDVAITAACAVQSIPEIKSRHLIARTYRVAGVHTMSRSGAANAVLKKLVREELGIENLHAGKAPIDEQIRLGDVISDRITFASRYLRNFLDTVKDFTSTFDAPLQREVSIGTTRYRVREGGLHDMQTNNFFRSTGRFQFLEADVKSYYPNLMLSLGIYPRHLDGFLDIFSRLVEQRIAAVDAGDRDLGSILKIFINAVFGKLGEKTSWLYDRAALLGVTMNGQLALLMLIERLEMQGIPVVYANTDGIVCKLNEHQHTSMQTIVRTWSRTMGLTVEIEPYQTMAIANCNNYVWLTPDGKTKTKGRMFDQVPTMGAGFDRPIIARAAINDMLYDIPIPETIHGSRDVLDFATFFKPSKKFDMHYVELSEDNRLSYQLLQRINRYAPAIGTAGALMKINSETGEERYAPHGRRCILLNEVQDHDPAHYPLDYAHYLGEANRIVGAVTRGRQMQLFD